MSKKYPDAYVVTLRIAATDDGGTLISDEDGNVASHTTCVDILLHTNASGNLFFPREIFYEARDLLVAAEETNGSLQ